MSSRLHVTSSSALGFVARFFGAMGSNPAIQYVAPNGNDAASGADWTNAKATVLAAYDALPAGGAVTNAGGIIYIAAGSYIGGEVTAQGIWIIGPNDPLYATPPTGWRKEKTVRFVGVGQDAGTQFAIGNDVYLYPGHPGDGGWPFDANHPFIWLSGTNTGIWFENVSTRYPVVGIRLGVSTDQTSRNINTAFAWFQNVAVQVVDNGGGPVVDVGYAFWVYFVNCVFIGAFHDSGGSLLATTADARAVVLLKPDAGGSSPSLFTIRNNRWQAGGLKCSRGITGAGSLYIEDVLVESDFVHALPPVVWITDLNNTYGSVIIRGVQTADAAAASMPTVQIDGQASASDAVTCIGVNGSIQGPCTVLGEATVGESFLVATPLRNGQTGFAGGRVLGAHDGARRRFAPTAVRFANLAQQDVTLWSGLTGGATVTTGQTAPDGTTNAALLTSSSGRQDRQPYRGNRTYAIGDIVVVGGWLRATTPVHGSAPAVVFDINSPSGFSYATLDGGTTLSTGSSLVATSPFLGDGEWVWVSQAAKITVIGTNPADTIFALWVYNGVPSVFYAPVFLHIPTGTISDNEAAELATHIQSWSNAATVGHISPLKGEVINAIGGLATITKAGVPVDGDYATPVDGLIVTDTTNNKIWTRIGGAWKGVTVT